MGAVKKLGKRIERGVKQQFFGGAEEEAAEKQAAAAERGQDIIAQQFEQTRGVLAPFAESPGAAAAFRRQQALAGALGPEEQAAAFEQFKESPATQFLRERGLETIEKQFAARGGLGGGNRLKAISEFNQQLAQQQLANQFNQLGAITGVGLQAGSALGGIGAQQAAGQAQQVGLAGQALAQGVLGKKEAIQGTISDVAQGIGSFATGGAIPPPQIGGTTQAGLGQTFAGFA